MVSSMSFDHTEATVGFEPTNGGFADPCLTRLGYVARESIGNRDMPVGVRFD
jgi:hypothetical protein